MREPFILTKLGCKSNRYFTTVILAILLFFSFQNAKCQNLVASYSLDNFFDDISYISNHLQVYGTSSDVSFVPGFSDATNNSAVFFQNENGLESLIKIDNSKWDGIAVSLWIKSCKDGPIFQGANFGTGISIDSRGRLLTYCDGSSSNALFATGVNLVDGDWHHIVAQSNGTLTELYIDGTLNGNLSEKMYRISNLSLNSKIYLGTIQSGLSNVYGHIDQVKLFDKELTQCQITSLYQEKKNLFVANITELEFTALPNPANTRIYMTCLPSDATIQIIDMNGKIIEEATTTTGSISINHLASGVYHLRVLDRAAILVEELRLVKY